MTPKYVRKCSIHVCLNLPNIFSLTILRSWSDSCGPLRSSPLWCVYWPLKDWEPVKAVWGLLWAETGPIHTGEDRREPTNTASTFVQDEMDSGVETDSDCLQMFLYSELPHRLLLYPWLAFHFVSRYSIKTFWKYKPRAYSQWLMKIIKWIGVRLVST